MTPIKTAVTVKASKKADKTAADIQKRSDKNVLDLTLRRSLVNCLKTFFVLY